MKLQFEISSTKTPQGYKVYVLLDQDLVVNTSYSGIIQVGTPGELEYLQTQLLTMPSDGYFYTFLTNYSDTQVSFDNLTIHHKQGVLRTQYDYYPYGLVWGRSLTPNPNKGYNETYQGSEFNYHEWGDVGLDLNYFEARYYDPVMGRFHAPDPMEQFHSPYMANFDDPANHIDPDGRASKDREYNLQMAGGLAVGWGFMAWAAFGGSSGVGQAIEGIAAIANLGGASNTIATAGNGGIAKLGQSTAVHDASATNQFGMNGNGPETYGGSTSNLSAGIGRNFGGRDPESGEWGNGPGHPCGKPRTIYLIATSSATSHLTKQGTSLKKIAQQLNDSFSLLGIDVKAEAWENGPSSFDTCELAKSSSVALFSAGNADGAEATEKYLDENWGKAMKPGGNDYWWGGSGNPEQSENGCDSGEEAQMINVDAAALSGFSKNANLTDERDYVTKTGALLVMHGAGHNASLNHSWSPDKPNCGHNYSDIMRSADDIATLFINATFSEGTGCGATIGQMEDGPFFRNIEYIKAMRTRFK